jgi:putative tricarboxylic transport membrane protein
LRLNDALTGTLLIAFSGAVIAYTVTFPAFPGQRYGPALFPRLLAGGVALLCVALVLRGLAERRATGAPWLAPPAFLADPWRAMSFGLVVAGVLAFILAGESVGFIPMAVLILAGLMLWLRVRPALAVVIAAGAAFLMHWFFSVLLRVPLPRGLLTTWL